MVNRLPSWFFLATSLILIGLALLPVMRVLFGIDQQIGMQFMTVVMLLIGGLMSGLTAMILLVRRQANIDWTKQASTLSKSEIKIKSLQIHSSGLLLYVGIPLLNFLVAYWLWVKHRRSCETLDTIGKEVLNFQITIYLYLLMSLFLVFAAIGIVTSPLILLFHFLVTIFALAKVSAGKSFLFPTNIPIIQSRVATPLVGS